MNEYQLISDYKQNENIRKALMTLQNMYLNWILKDGMTGAVGMITIFAILMWMEIKSSQIHLLIK